MTKLTDKKLAKMQQLLETGLSNHKIAKILNISHESVRNYRSKVVKTTDEVKKDVRHVKNIRSNKRNRKRRPGDPGDNISKEGAGLPNDPAPSNDTFGETPEALIFVGGKKYMTSKNKDENKTDNDEENEYQCYNCKHTQGSIFSQCPKCGSINVFEG